MLRTQRTSTLQSFVGLGPSFALPVAFFSLVQWDTQSLTPWPRRTRIYVPPQPWWWLSESVTDCPHFRTLAARVVLAAQQPNGLSGVLGQVPIFGGCQEQAVLKQLPLSAWHRQQFVRLSRKPGEKAVGRTGAVDVCLWPPSPSAAPSRQHPRLLQRRLPQMGTGWRGLPGHPRNPWGTADRAASQRWANPLRVPRVLYLETEKGGWARPFLFFTTLVFHSGKYRQVKIFTPTSRIQSYVSSGSFTARFRMPQ